MKWLTNTQKSEYQQKDGIQAYYRKITNHTASTSRLTRQKKIILHHSMLISHLEFYTKLSVITKLESKEGRLFLVSFRFQRGKDTGLFLYKSLFIFPLAQTSSERKERFTSPLCVNLLHIVCWCCSNLWFWWRYKWKWQYSSDSNMVICVQCVSVQCMYYEFLNAIASLQLIMSVSQSVSLYQSNKDYTTFITYMATFRN